MSGNYTEENIKTLEGLDHILARPTAYFNSTDVDGLIHQALEIITNSIDEIALKPEGDRHLKILLCVDAENETYQLVVSDNGRGLPIGKLLDSFTKLHTSGKFDTKAYATSGGLLGVGAKATAGTSNDLRAITHCPEGSASIRVHKGKSDNNLEYLPIPPLKTGMTVIFQPNPDVFQTDDIVLFAGSEGQKKLLLVLQKFCFFGHMSIEFRVHQTGLPDKIWTIPLVEAEEIVQEYWNSPDTRQIFNEADFNRFEWIRNYWGVTRPFTLSFYTEDTFITQHATDLTREAKTRYEIWVHLVKFDTIGGRFGMVNNLSIDDAKSTHISTVTDLIKLMVSNHIKDSSVRKFFLESYRIPLYLAVDVKYPGAQPAGMSKHAFISKAFKIVYNESLQKRFSTPEGITFISALYAELADDIESKYLIEETGISKVKNQDRLFEQFEGISKRFFDCSTQDRRMTELFLVEGNSAGGGAEGRDSVTQGIYMLRGKPFNGIISQDDLRQSVINIRNDRVYREILSITRINPAKFNKEDLYFSKILIMTDADVHGQHISAILTGNLYALNPEIITSGIVHIVVPPLYSLEYIGRKQGLPKIYFKDEDELQGWFIKYVYLKAFDVGIRLKGHTETHYFDSHNSTNFLRLVIAIGQAIENVSEELILDPMVVERLTHVTGYLEDNNIDVDGIRTVLRKLDPTVDRISYEPDGHILVMTIGRDDHIIPLQNVRRRLIELVLPLMNKIRWRTIRVYITTKHTAELKDEHVSLMRLFFILKSFDGLFKPHRYKGIGSMEPNDKERTCMDPKTRNVFQITSPGDVSRIFELLGKKNSSYRKRLVSS